MKLTSQKRTRTRRLQAAFTLIETSIGVGVMGTIMMALFSGFATGFFTMQMARENLRATQILLEKMETIRLYTWDQVNDPNFIPPTFTAPYDPNDKDGNTGVLYQGTMSITNVALPNSYAQHMREVKVTLTWTTGHLQRRREFTSYISRNGLQSYIY